MAEVKTELLWTTNVTPAPTNMATYPASHSNGEGRSVETQFQEEMSDCTNKKHWENASAAHGLPTCVDDLMYDFCYVTFEERVKQLDQEQQTGAEDGQGGCQQNQTHGEVW